MCVHVYTCQREYVHLHYYTHIHIYIYVWVQCVRMSRGTSMCCESVLIQFDLLTLKTSMKKLQRIDKQIPVIR